MPKPNGSVNEMPQAKTIPFTLVATSCNFVFVTESVRNEGVLNRVVAEAAAPGI